MVGRMLVLLGEDPLTPNHVRVGHHTILLATVGRIHWNRIIINKYNKQEEVR